jgi:hypothetical protein
MLHIRCARPAAPYHSAISKRHGPEAVSSRAPHPSPPDNQPRALRVRVPGFRRQSAPPRDEFPVAREEVRSQLSNHQDVLVTPPRKQAHRPGHARKLPLPLTTKAPIPVCPFSPAAAALYLDATQRASSPPRTCRIASLERHSFAAQDVFRDPQKLRPVCECSHAWDLHRMSHPGSAAPQGALRKHGTQIEDLIFRNQIWNNREAALFKRLL